MEQHSCADETVRRTMAESAGRSKRPAVAPPFPACNSARAMTASDAAVPDRLP
jgi:hypothetical protein